MAKMFELLRSKMKDNSGDENITKMVWISIAFIVGAILIALLTTAFKGPVSNWFNKKINEWFNDSNGTPLINGST